jgi:hypothetical protein
MGNIGLVLEYVVLKGTLKQLTDLLNTLKPNPWNSGAIAER